MERIYRECQSCGMMLNKSPHGGGTNADGTISRMYCAYCYEKGEFRQPKWTVHQMQEFIRASLKATGMQDFQALAAAKGITKLERWKNAQPAAPGVPAPKPVAGPKPATIAVKQSKTVVKPDKPKQKKADVRAPEMKKKR
ncbi:MAG: hypothetical protein A2X67_01075 [Ignavibacteria bacterium GWA2_55_11]|nr:MAG: hypothetical protein A2X67_01075 [Ignavibacteria bacterium GWA2_55_11]OGU47242.1 MAG: hypothetical protein A2X68_13100 [Ignavibacteria bacterium GWC2_56_12]OGU68680.1 MAG: hypothetical protein A3C56_07880 [Ignavibacteria bacterium RIFCSPHIGHO2_02_FULL_56_12]OGU70062.1 MAG: hypothetical protein A3H45_09550 [Ignavibacteria bacterium RIFCSPLOWO2_02_FULL_55_14]OGU75830.1 MAG: hypothetical protein A3G43_00815 [Ignavibacteria bacterium RIFCSPLOWO2_12_FULL_56_21]HAV22836.1 hypothetical protei